MKHNGRAAKVFYRWANTALISIRVSYDQRTITDSNRRSSDKAHVQTSTISQQVTTTNTFPYKKIRIPV